MYFSSFGSSLTLVSVNLLSGPFWFYKLWSHWLHLSPLQSDWDFSSSICGSLSFPSNLSFSRLSSIPLFLEGDQGDFFRCGFSIDLNKDRTIISVLFLSIFSPYANMSWVPNALWTVVFMGQYCTFSWRRKWQPTPGFLPEKSRGQRSLVSYSPWGCKELNTTEWLSTQCTFKNYFILYWSIVDLQCWVGFCTSYYSCA